MTCSVSSPATSRHLLPFPVLDPSHWYLHDVLASVPGAGLMFGVVAQSIIGWDWVELVVRGAVLGLVCAAVHRWYARSSDLWSTVLYLFLCVWAYYTVRATTSHVVSLVVLRLLPSVLVLVAAAFVLGWLRTAPSWPGRLPEYGSMARTAASVQGTGSTTWTWAVRRAQLGERRLRGGFPTVGWWSATPGSSIKGGATQPGVMPRRTFTWRRGRTLSA